MTRTVVAPVRTGQISRQQIAELRVRCQQEPGSVERHREAITELLAAGVTSEALPLLRRLASLCPGDAQVGAQLAAILSAHGDTQAALEQCSRVAVLTPDSAEAHHNLGVAACKLEDYSRAREAFERKLELEPNAFETWNDLAVIHALTGHPDEAARCYRRCLEINPRYDKARENALEFFCDTQRFAEGLALIEMLTSAGAGDAELAVWGRRLESSVAGVNLHGERGIAPGPSHLTGRKIAFVASSGTFLTQIVEHFASANEVRTVRTESPADLASALQWADLTWFEWCDALAVAGSRLPRRGKAVCRLHSYEAFTGAPAQMNWGAIDRLILVSDAVGEILDQTCKIPVRRQVIHNGVDPHRFPFTPRPRRGKRIASVGYINYKKNPSLLLQTFKAIHDWDRGFEFHIAGEHQDPRIKVYFDNLLPRLKIPVTFHGWVDDMPAFYAGMDYVVSTSLFESFHYSIAEGMLSGCLPLVHSWKGAESLYPPSCIFDTPSQAIDIIKKYQSSNGEAIANENRDYIIRRFNWPDRLAEIDVLLGEVLKGSADAAASRRRPLTFTSSAKSKADYGSVSAVVVAHNQSEYIADAVTALLNQTYQNLEIIVADDGSTDDTPRLLEQFGDQVRAVRQIRRGFAAAANLGIQACHGEFVLVVSAADVCGPEMVEKLVSRMAADPDVGLVSCQATLIDSSNEPVGESSKSTEWLSEADRDRDDPARLPRSCVMFRRRALDDTGWFEESAPEPDSDQRALASLWRRIASSHQARSLNEPLACVRRDATARHNWTSADVIPPLDHERWLHVVQRKAEGSNAANPAPPVPAPEKTGARVVFAGAVDPGGQMSMWAEALNRYTHHRARVLTHAEACGYPGDLIIKQTAKSVSPLAVIDEAERIAKDADILIFAAGLAPGRRRAEMKMADTDEQPYGTIHWPSVTGPRRRIALLFGTPSVRANLGWYRNHFASKGWPLLTLEPGIHRWLTEAQFIPRLLIRDSARYAPCEKHPGATGIIHPGGREPHEGGAFLIEVAAAIKKRHPHAVFGRYQDMPWSEVLDLKRRAHIGFDRIAVGHGDFGLDSLENTALGLLNIVYCSSYTRELMAGILGTDEWPWEGPATAAELTDVLSRYLSHPDRLERAMDDSHQWFNRYWDEQQIVQTVAGVLDRF